MLTPDERRLIFQYCWDHLVASCEPCQTQYRIDELGADLYRGLSHLCTKCRADLSASAREHIASCTVLRVQEAESKRKRTPEWSAVPPLTALPARTPTVMDQQDPIRLLIQSKLADGRLPRNSIRRVRGGTGNGETCDACDEVITKKQLLMEEVGLGKKAVQFHVACFSVWDELRRTPAA